jgi:DNA-directed RNA polymerase sigma subunit (sigma70/sigma32)
VGGLRIETRAGSGKGGFMTALTTQAEAAHRHETPEAPELLAGYLAHIGTGRLLTHEEEMELSEMARAGGLEGRRARQELVERNLRWS